MMTQKEMVEYIKSAAAQKTRDGFMSSDLKESLPEEEYNLFCETEGLVADAIMKLKVRIKPERQALIDTGNAAQIDAAANAAANAEPATTPITPEDPLFPESPASP